jgi:hypothetical protein
MVLLQRISFQVLHLVCKIHNHITAASSSRGLEFCEDKQIWLIKKNYEDNKCNRGVKSEIMEEAACISRSTWYVFVFLL